MKLKLCMAACMFVFTGTSFAQQQTEDQCKKNVEVSISAIEMMTQRNGTEQQLKDLSVKDIREIQKAKGNCVAQQEINKRTQ